MSISQQTLIQFEISETPEGRAFWLTKEWASNVDDMDKSADVVVLPWPNFREDKPLFPNGSSDIVAEIQQNANIQISYGINEELYEEILLHANILRIPTLLCKQVVFPIVLGILSNHIDQWIASAPGNDTVEAQVIIEAPSRVPLKVTFKGPASQFHDFMMRVEQI